MVHKEIIGILLLSGCLQIFASDNQDNISNISNEDFHSKEINSFQKHNKKHWKKVRDADLQFQGDYKTWGDKKYPDHNFKEFKDKMNHLKFNEIDSGEYYDKYKKYREASVLYKKKGESYKKRRNSENKDTVVSTNLLWDIDVNFIKNNKELNEDSEIIYTDATPKNKEEFKENFQNGNELYQKRTKRKSYKNLILTDLTKPPPPNDTILMARYILHSVDWATIGTLSRKFQGEDYPFVCVKAISDGMNNASTGIPFFYMSSKDICTQNIERNNHASVLVTLSETDYCKQQNLDPQDPRCAKLTLNGKIKKITPGSDEEEFARNALFSKHPAMSSWPEDHHFYFTKLKIGQIVLLDHFGGATYIKVKDYLNCNFLKS